MADYIPRSNEWMMNGTHGGLLIESSTSALTSIGSNTSLCLDVLDSVYGHEELVTAMTSRAWIDDLKFGRFGRDWDEERSAIAMNSVKEFQEYWPQMRVRLSEALLVSTVSALENYVKALLIEFPVIGLNSDASLISTISELEWSKADRSYRMAVKAKHSVCQAWISLCRNSSIPDAVKSDVDAWGSEGFAPLIDEMVLLRNSLVHSAGIADQKLAPLLRIRPGTRVSISEESKARYSHAYLGFLCAIDPSF